jgi:hypothetical protein
MKVKGLYNLSWIVPYPIEFNFSFQKHYYVVVFQEVSTMRESHSLLGNFKILAEVFTTSIWSKYLNTLFNLYFNFIYEFFEPFKWFRISSNIYDHIQYVINDETCSMTRIIIGLYTSTYIRPNNSLDLSLFE